MNVNIEAGTLLINSGRAIAEGIVDLLGNPVLDVQLLLPLFLQPLVPLVHCQLDLVFLFLPLTVIKYIFE